MCLHVRGRHQAFVPIKKQGDSESYTARHSGTSAVPCPGSGRLPQVADSTDQHEQRA